MWMAVPPGTSELRSAQAAAARGVRIITGSDFLRNTAHDGGGIFSSLISNDQALMDTRLVDNRAGADGGGVYNDSTEDPGGETWTATASQFIGKVAGSAGGGIFDTGPVTATVTNSQVRANEPANCAPPGSVTGCTG
jgi:hypothetical protein